MVEYKKTKKSIKVNGKKKNVYVKVGTVKKYVNYKNKKVRLGKYKKMMKAKKSKKSGGGKRCKKNCRK